MRHATVKATFEVKSPCVFILILNWRGVEDTMECARSCAALNYPNFRIVIIDNGSGDNSESVLRSTFPNVDILQTGGNLGFAGGNNVGIKFALRNGADYVWLLNNDAVVESSALKELVSSAEQNPAIAIVGSKIYYFDQPNVLWHAGALINNDVGDALHVGNLESDCGQYDTPRECDYVTGCSFLIKCNVIEKIGMIDEAYFLLWEDVDWCERARKKGYAVVYVPSSRVWHKVSKSIGMYSRLALYYYSRNSLLFILKHKPLRLIPIMLRRWRKIRRHHKGGETKHARCHALALRDFLLFRWGHR